MRQQINGSIDFKASIDNSGVTSSKSKNKNLKYLAALGSVNQTLSGSKTSTSDRLT